MGQLTDFLYQFQFGLNTKIADAIGNFAKQNNVPVHINRMDDPNWDPYEAPHAAMRKALVEYLKKNESDPAEAEAGRSDRKRDLVMSLGRFSFENKGENLVNPFERHGKVAEHLYETVFEPLKKEALALEDNLDRQSIKERYTGKS